MSSPWSDFKVGTPSTKDNWVELDCCPLTRVFHVAHSKEALRVLEDGRIRSGLIYDESRLNKKRTCVSWVSPNPWVDGSIYGHVQFSFDWGDLISGKTIYWVEAPVTDKQQIVRLLISDGPFVDEELEEYDASLGDGPLYHDTASDRWYYNHPLTNEYMILADLPLDDCVGVTFCNHHPKICKKKFEHCADKKRLGREVGAEVLGRLLGAGMTDWASKFESDTHTGEIDPRVLEALQILLGRLCAADTATAEPACSGATSLSLIGSMCSAVSYGQAGRLKNLAGFFSSSDHIKESFWTCAQKFFKGLKVSGK